MSTLVLQVHPLTGSYNAALLEAVTDTLTTAGRAHRVVRLGQGQTLDPDDLVGIGHLVVVAPTWWGAMPAQLLAWIQDHLAPWIDGEPPDRPSPLHTVQRLSVVATHGSSRFINRLQGEPGLHLWRRTVLPLCAPGARFDWIARYQLDRIDEAARAAFVARVGATLAALPEPEPEPGRASA